MVQKTTMLRKPGKRSIHAWLNDERVAGLICTSPFIIGFFMFLIIPMCLSAYYSLCNFNITSDPVFVGMANFTKMFGDAKFWKALQVTFFYAMVSVPLRLLFALIVALILLKTTKMTAFYRAAYYLPSIIGGSVAVSILWKQMFAKAGTINMLLQGVGINCTIAWLGNVDTAIWTLILLSVWQFGSSMLIFLSSLKQIPSTLYEAAEVDGANGLRRFFKITLPLLTPTIFFNMVMSIIGSWQVFTQSFVMTEGGPNNATLTLVLYLYRKAFQQFYFGYSAAIAWLLFGVVLIFVVIAIRSASSWVVYERV